MQKDFAAHTSRKESPLGQHSETSSRVFSRTLTLDWATPVILVFVPPSKIQIYSRVYLGEREQAIWLITAQYYVGWAQGDNTDEEWVLSPSIINGRGKRCWSDKTDCCPFQKVMDLFSYSLCTYFFPLKPQHVFTCSLNYPRHPERRIPKKHTSGHW